MLKKILFVCFLILCNICVYAFQKEDVSNIENIATHFIKERIKTDPNDSIEVKIDNLSNFSDLKKCDGEININVPEGNSSQGFSTLLMSCKGSAAWSVYIPVSIKVLTNVLVAAKTISAKEPITGDMIDIARMDKNQLFSGYYTSQDEIIGLNTTTTLAKGTLFTKKNLHKPIIINKNQMVSIVSHNDAITVKADGIAKENGGLNDLIKVMNASSKRVIDGTVIDSRTVMVR